jgi:hypothetical protein
MSDYIYENRQLSLWDEYKDLNGTLSMDAFMERHYKVNAYIINLMKQNGPLPDSVDRAAWVGDDYADAYANPRGGI